MSTAKTEEQKARKRERDRKYRERKRALKANGAKPQAKKSNTRPFAVRIILPKELKGKTILKAKKPVNAAEAKKPVKVKKIKLVSNKGLPIPIEKRVAIAAVALRALSLFLAHD